MAKNLILFSGGYDSTYLVYKYLVDTSDEITLLVMTSENNLADGLNRLQLLKMKPT
jgi:7-cyano-7-deazaguanine synthase in queuosine biosynthesis